MSPNREAVYASAAIWNNLEKILDRHECSGIAVEWNGVFTECLMLSSHQRRFDGALKRRAKRHQSVTMLD